MINKINKLFEDWYKSKSSSERKKIKGLLEKKNHISFNKLIKVMENDGRRLKALSDGLKGDSVKVRKALAEGFHLIAEEDGSVVGEIDSLYEPIENRSNQMYSVIDDIDDSADFEPGMVQRIKQAIVGGNYEIANQLIKKGWNQLSLYDRNFLIGFVNDMCMYDPGDKGFSKLKPLEKKSDKTKDEFTKELLTTALDNMKIS